MKGFSRTTGFYASLLLALTLGAMGCKGSQDANSTPASTADQSQQAASQQAADQAPPDPSDPANANIVPVSNATTDTSGSSGSTAAPAAPSRAAAPSSSGTAAAPSSEPASSDNQSSAQLSTAQYNEDNGYGQQPETYAQQPPPELPQYQQPICPGPGYIFTPGYWGYAQTGYYWIPGAWVHAPYQGALWTPGYWGSRGGRYAYYRGYWGRHIGYYGGINYGFGYVGVGYHGGYWRGNDFMYNRTVNNIDVHVVRNVYDYRVVNVMNTRVSFNGGHGGVQYRPRQYEIVATVREQHNPPMQAQIQIREGAERDRRNFVEVNHGRPEVVVVEHPVQADRNVRPPAEVHYREDPMRAIAQRPDPNHPGRPIEERHPYPPQHGQPSRQEPSRDVHPGQHPQNSRELQDHNKQHPVPHQPTPQHADANHHPQQNHGNDQKKNDEKKRPEDRRPQ